MECVHNFKGEVQELGRRVNHLYQKMGEFASLHNTLVDAYNDEEDEIEKHKAKVADLDCCSWWNNVRIRGIHESVQNEQL